MGAFQLRGAEKEECPLAHFTLGHIMGTMPGLYMSVCLWTDLCQCNSVTTMADGVQNLYK